MSEEKDENVVFEEKVVCRDNQGNKYCILFIQMHSCNENDLIEAIIRISIMQIANQDQYHHYRLLILCDYSDDYLDFESEMLCQTIIGDQDLDEMIDVKVINFDCIDDVYQTKGIQDLNDIEKLIFIMKHYDHTEYQNLFEQIRKEDPKAKEILAAFDHVKKNPVN